MKKIIAVIAIALTCLLGIFIYSWRDVIFQNGNPIPYLIAASKITEENSYVEVDKNIVISKIGGCPELFDDVEELLGVEYTEQAGSGYIFTDGTKSYTMSSEIYLGRYIVWTLPTVD